MVNEVNYVFWGFSAKSKKNQVGRNLNVFISKTVLSFVCCLSSEVFYLKEGHCVLSLIYELNIATKERSSLVYF